MNKENDELKEFVFSQYETEEKDSSLQEMFCEIGIKKLGNITNYIVYVYGYIGPPL